MLKPPWKTKDIMKIRILGMTLLATALTACSTVTPTTTSTASTTIPAEAASWKNREAELKRLQTWQVNGKIAVRTAKDSGSATVNWSERHGSYRIYLAGPLGSHGLQLNGEPGHVVLETSEGKRLTANTAEQLLEQNWGFDLPVSYIKYWVRGIPVPGITNNTQFDSQGRINHLVQDGWRVQYQSYTHKGNLDLPARLSINSDRLDVKIIIYDWKIA